MMGRPRSSLQTKLETILGSNKVYFQPPPNVTMQYPAIVYERDDSFLASADNIPYAFMWRYQVTYIDHFPKGDAPESDVIAKLAALPYSDFSRHFATSGLNHDVFVIYH